MNQASNSLSAASAAPARFTASEFLRMAELGAFADMKVELDHGEIVRMNPPLGLHGAGQAQIIAKLYDTLRGTGFAVVGEAAVNLGFETVRAFDVAVLRPGVNLRGPLLPSEILLAVEISDTTLAYDLGAKLGDYATAKLDHYWVVDVNARAVHLMSDPREGSYGLRAVSRFGEPLALPNGLGSIVLD